MEFWQQLAERNGPWAIFLLLVLFFLWKWVLPFVKERIAAADDALREQITAAREARKEDQAEFLKALERRDAQTRELTEAIRQLTVKIEGRAHK